MLPILLFVISSSLEIDFTNAAAGKSCAGPTAPATFAAAGNSTSNSTATLGAIPLDKYTYTAGPYGPENWGKLWPTCSGKFQSPINFNSSYLLPNRNVNKSGPTLLPGYEHVANLSVDAKGHGLVFGTAGAGFNQVDGETYIFKSIHVHCPSEHRIDGIRKWSHEVYTIS